MSKADKFYAMVLASGDDQGLEPLVEALTGAALPKQFAHIAGRGSLLQQTVARYISLIPPERMIVVVPFAYEAIARDQLSDWGHIEIIAQPAGCDANVDLLLPLGRVLSRMPDANVLVTPAHHYVPFPAPLLDQVRVARQAMDRIPLVLLGVASGRRRASRGWIVPSQPLGGGLFSVAALREDSSPAQAVEFASAGALWSTSTCVARAEYLWHLASRHMPMLAEAVARYWSDRRGSNKAALSTSLFSLELNGALLRGATDLAVLPVKGSGWTDWSSVEHVVDSLDNPQELELLLTRIIEKQRAAGRTELRGRPRHLPSHATAA